MRIDVHAHYFPNRYLDRLERYYDAVPRGDAAAEQVGPFTLFVRHGPGWPYYARPIPGADLPTQDEVAAVRTRQRDLGVPEALEWIHDVVPGMLAVARAARMKVKEVPLMVLGDGRWRTPEPQCRR